MLVAFGDVRALEDLRCTILRAAAARNGDLVGQAVFARHKLPAGSVAVGAILKRHGDSIRAQRARGKVREVWKVVNRREERAYAREAGSSAPRGALPPRWHDAACAQRCARRRAPILPGPRARIPSSAAPSPSFSRACSG